MTVCNMSIEAGARAGMIAPDETTFAYLEGRPRAPQGRGIGTRRSQRWRTLPPIRARRSMPRFDIDASTLEPMITYGTQSRAWCCRSTRSIPDKRGDDAVRQGARATWGFTAAKPCSASPSTSCSSAAAPTDASRICRRPPTFSRAARWRRACACSIVPGSQQIKREAEAAGLHDMFKAAGADWRESGCSMCLGMNGDTVGAGQYSVSTSNRNFEGRQGVGARTLLASPLHRGGERRAGPDQPIRGRCCECSP